MITSLINNAKATSTWFPGSRPDQINFTMQQKIPLFHYNNYFTDNTATHVCYTLSKRIITMITA